MILLTCVPPLVKIREQKNVEHKWANVGGFILWNACVVKHVHRFYSHLLSVKVVRVTMIAVQSSHKTNTNEHAVSIPIGWAKCAGAKERTEKEANLLAHYCSNVSVVAFI